MKARLLTMAVAAALLCGCGQATELTEPTVADGAPMGELTVRFVYAEGSSLYAEGARHFLEVSRPDGAVVVRRDEGTEQGPGAGYVDSLRLEEGRYEVRTFQRGCNWPEGTDCETTRDPDSQPCTAEVMIRQGARSTVSISLLLGGDPARRCDVEVSDGSTSPEPEALVGVGIVLDDGDGPKLCLGGVMESLPPQCGGPEVVGWDWAEFRGEESARGTRWTDAVVVTGKYDGDAFTLTEPAVPLDEYDGPLPSDDGDRSLGTPCPEPAGGWPTDHPGTMADFEEAAAAAARLDGYSDSWVDYLDPPGHSVEGGYEPDNVILNVRMVGDQAAAASALRKIWPGALCVSTAERTEAELRRIQHEVSQVEGMLGSSAGFDVVELRVIHDDGSLQRRMNERYGKGVVRVSSALVPPAELD